MQLKQVTYQRTEHSVAPPINPLYAISGYRATYSGSISCLSMALKGQLLILRDFGQTTVNDCRTNFVTLLQERSRNPPIIV